MRRVTVITMLAVVLFAVPASADLPVTKVCVKDTCVIAEIADTDETRMVGLMYRESLSAGCGMLFVFPEEGEYNFWMLNMRFPIDIIWIDTNNRIADIKHNVPPCADTCPSLKPAARSRYVLEVPSGFASRNKIAVGDTASFTLSRP